MAQEQTILPKGIVLNRIAVYEEIAKYDIIPVEQILRACHVFSTTSRELYDPTARRLENFWTRILGGDRRYLSGRVIAGLFKDISEETSFVKLRGPDNRYEPPSPQSSTYTSHNVEMNSLAPASKPVIKSTTSSAKAPHPILKKPRGPSSSGPRPTARFVSPPGSGIDKDSVRKGEITTPTTAPQSGNPRDSVISTTKDERKRVPPQKPKKKTTAFVASASSKRRPGMPRRTSSQSSAGASTGTSEVGQKEGESSVGSKHDGSQSSVPTIPEKPEQQPAMLRKEKDKVLSAKAAGKRPATQPPVDGTSRTHTTASREPQREISSAKQVNTKTEEARAGQQKRGEKATRHTENLAKVPLSASVQANYTKKQPDIESSGSSSDMSMTSPPREVSRSFVPTSSLMSPTLAKLDTSVIGQATLLGVAEDMRAQHSPTAAAGPFGGSGSIDVPEKALESSGHSRQMTPTQPANSATIPLGRSMSQLSILLNRNAEKKFGR
ncbi:hypothetical protein F4777DRAFT_585151 [Nemania sp. FL0916]|nr:hypothetical protein F4777DRAFT_585151 [Nemania sp. FL0916]